MNMKPLCEFLFLVIIFSSSIVKAISADVRYPGGVNLCPTHPSETKAPAGKNVSAQTSGHQRTSGEVMSGNVNVGQTIEAVENGTCFTRDAFAKAEPEVREIMRGYQNGQGVLPVSPQDALKDPSCRPLDYKESLVHDFNDRVAEMCNMSSEARAQCYIDALKEYLGGLPAGTVLNVEGEHNIKIACADGREYVFDKDGKIITKGINAGTFNISEPEEWLAHTWNDIFAAMNGLPPKSSLTKEECVSLLQQYLDKRAKTAETTQDLFQGNLVDNPNDDSKNLIDTSKLEGLLSQQVTFVESLLAKGTRATDGEIGIYNSRQTEMVKEVMNIVTKVQALTIPDEEKKRVVEKSFTKVTPLAEKLERLSNQAVSNNIVGGIKPMSLNGLNGLGTQAPANDDSSCKCTNPSLQYTKVSDSIPAAVMCKKCGKTAGVALHGKIISKNPAASGMSVK